jgi:hypothetical protein
MMKGNDQSKVDEEKPVGLTLYKPEDQIFQSISVSIWENYMKPLKRKMNTRKRKRKSFDAMSVRNVNRAPTNVHSKIALQAKDYE